MTPDLSPLEYVALIKARMLRAQPQTTDTWYVFEIARLAELKLRAEQQRIHAIEAAYPDWHGPR